MDIQTAQLMKNLKSDGYTNIGCDDIIASLKPDGSVLVNVKTDLRYLYANTEDFERHFLMGIGFNTKFEEIRRKISFVIAVRNGGRTLSFYQPEYMTLRVDKTQNNRADGKQFCEFIDDKDMHPAQAISITPANAANVTINHASVLEDIVTNFPCVLQMSDGTYNNAMLDMGHVNTKEEYHKLLEILGINANSTFGKAIQSYDYLFFTKPY